MTRPNRSEYATTRRLAREVMPGCESKAVFLAAAIVQSRFTTRMVPVQVIDFYRAVAALPLLHNQER
jgi:hypothetical protein